MINQNNWKLLASKTPKSQKDSEDRKKNTSKKYEPKKMTYNEETSIITSKINNSFSKLNSSSLAHDRKENSLSRNSSIIKSRR